MTCSTLVGHPEPERQAGCRSRLRAGRCSRPGGADVMAFSASAGSSRSEAKNSWLRRTAVGRPAAGGPRRTRLRHAPDQLPPTQLVERQTSPVPEGFSIALIVTRLRLSSSTTSTGFTTRPTRSPRRRLSAQARLPESSSVRANFVGALTGTGRSRRRSPRASTIRYPIRYGVDPNVLGQGLIG